MASIAIIGMACRYAEARSPWELWENVLAQRRSFRRIPRVRLNLADYSSESQGDDRISLAMAAVLDDYEFDRSRFHVSQEAFLTTDLTHWLALDVASQALADARLLEATSAQRERTSVYIGNSLTGEFSRANLLRLRWPYVQRVLAAALRESGTIPPEALEKLMARTESLYKAPFPATNAESLAGGLSNTIAGRICNYYDFKGGGYTVDGACASSLLAVATACSALRSGDVDIAIAGGVDLSLDPFELAGFSSLGALAPGKMRVFDAQSSGFWPGEGCGMVVLMRHEEARALDHTPYALIRGWGISSDGHGGITRPEIAGQALVLRRAYERSGYGIDSVAYFEGHGTGTTIGDATELQALSQARREAGGRSATAAVGSIKANIGHTKAAAGVAGLIKAALAVHVGVVPPTTGCDNPHPELTAGDPMLRVVREAELWPADAPVRASVSAFGFGGINAHVTLEAVETAPRKTFTPAEEEQAASAQDCELFVFAARTTRELSSQLEEVLRLAGEISFSELTDLSIGLARKAAGCAGHEMVRAACVASTPDELEIAVRKLLACCEAQAHRQLDVPGATFFSRHTTAPRIGFLFPGQASPVYTSGGIWSRRFPSLRRLFARARLPRLSSTNTATAQPCIVTASLAGLHVLELFGVQGLIGVGHSLGEITALHWAGACAEEDLMSMVRARGRAMADLGDPSGAMASIRASYAEVRERLNGDGLVVAARNAPLQTVVAGEANAVQRFADRLASAGVTATMLPVSHAFHSPLVAAAATAFSEHLSSLGFTGLRRRVISTVTATPLAPAADLKNLLARQITGPVLFADAFDIAAREADLFIEVGPGSVLSSIAAECSETPAIALDAGSESLRGLFSALGAAFVLGADLRLAPLFERFGRPIDIRKRHSFLANPCESAPESAPQARPASDSAAAPAVAASLPHAETAHSALDALMALVARRTQLPHAAIKPEHRFLTDLHLNSITISQIVLEAASQLSLPAPVAPAEYTNATLAEAAATLDALRSQSPRRSAERFPAGVDSWIRTLAVELKEKPLKEKPLWPAPPQSPGNWEVIASEEGSLLPDRLREEFSSVAGSGLVCCVPPELEERSAEFLLQAAQTALGRGVSQVVFIQHGGGAAALARALHLENPNIKVTVVDVPHDHPDAARWAAEEANANRGFMDAHYDRAGVRREPRLQLLWPQNDARADDPSLGPSDVLLVTGGGKGIAAESALHLGSLSGCRLALLGRSDPAADSELERNLQRISEAKVRFAYFATDITDAAAVAIAVQRINSELGPITALLHGAGANNPKRLEQITTADLAQTLAPKLTGLRHLLATIEPERLRLLLTFGSIIARTGLQGEAHYGLANEWLGLIVKRWQRDHQHCRCLNLEWSVWAGVGMGQRLGVLDSLVRQGITPLPIDDAIAQLKTLVAWKSSPSSAIITGRFGNLPTLKFDQPELPLLRFLEHCRVYHPGIELIADAELSSDADPYAAEHALQGEQLLPAVMGVEAMAQVAQALEQSERVPSFRNLHFVHPIVIPRNKPVTLRVAALRRRPGIISAVVRCSSTNFQIDHFSGECTFADQLPISDDHPAAPRTHRDLPLNRARDLYGRILFHQGRFRRVEGYELLRSKTSVARLAAPAQTPWFARHLPPDLVMGDPASRDAALHSIQACIPHKTILPVGIDRITAAATEWTRTSAVVHATERSCDGDNFVYDLRMEDASGRLCEQWEGLHLRAVSPIHSPDPWPLALLVPYLERKLEVSLLSGGIKVGLAGAAGKSCERAHTALVREMFGPSATLTHRLDGKPTIAGASGAEPCVSLSYSENLTLIFGAENAAGCDVEKIICRGPESWEQLLGAEGFTLARTLAGFAKTTLDEAGTQVWALKESLRKAGASFGQPISLSSWSPDGWAGFSGGGVRAATFHARVAESAAAMAFAFVIHRTS
jgi:enediyne polyketide synthase